MANADAQLAPPGAGLPPAERFVASLGFGLLRAVLHRRRIEAWLRAETARVLAIVRGLTPEQATRQVLVPRPLGLEDSSRNWSPGMVVEHLVIVDAGIAGIVEALCGDRDFGREVRIAEVKPSPDAGPEQWPRLEAALAGYLDRVAPIPDLRSARRHAHPWFGPLDAHGWHTLAALHTTIHRRQLEAVVRIGA